MELGELTMNVAERNKDTSLRMDKVGNKHSRGSEPECKSVSCSFSI